MAFLLSFPYPQLSNEMFKVYCEHCGTRNYCYFPTKKLCSDCNQKLPEWYYYFSESIASRLNYHLGPTKLPF